MKSIQYYIDKNFLLCYNKKFVYLQKLNTVLIYSLVNRKAQPSRKEVYGDN